MNTPARTAHVTGWGRYAPSQVLTNHDLERMVETSDEWIVSRTGIRERRVAAAHETTASMAAVAVDAGHPHGRHRPRRHRSHPAGDAHARLLDALDGGPGQGGHRQHPGGGDGRGGGLLRVRVRVRDGPGLHHERDGEARAGHRRGAADALPRLHRPQHLHPLRRRRRGGRAVGVRRARWRTRHRDDHRAAGRLHDLAAGRRGEEPAVGRDHRPRRALHPDGGQGDLPVRHEDAGDDGAEPRSSGPGWTHPISPCSSRTRRTSGSSRRSPRGSTCRWSGCS